MSKHTLRTWSQWVNKRNEETSRIRLEAFMISLTLTRDLKSFLWRKIRARWERLMLTTLQSWPTTNRSNFRCLSSPRQWTSRKRRSNKSVDSAVNRSTRTANKAYINSSSKMLANRWTRRRQRPCIMAWQLLSTITSSSSNHIRTISN